MASTYSTSLRIQLIGTGDQPGVWGTTTNNNLGQLIEEAITGVGAITLSGTSYTLSAFNGIIDESRNAVLSFTGSLSAACTVVAPAVPKVYIVKNGTSGGQNVIMSVGSGSTVSIPNGQTYIVYTDGVNFSSASNYNSSNVQITGGTIDNTTIGATTPSTGVFSDITAYNNATFGVSNAPQTVSITTATPALVTMAVGTTPAPNARVTFTSSGTLPVPLAVGVVYYVVKIDSTTFNLSTTSGGGSLVNTTSGYTGTISMVVNSDVTINTPTVNVPNNLKLVGTGALTVPVGTTAQQPGTPANGMIRYNSTNQYFEGYANGVWSQIGATSSTTTNGLWQNNQIISTTQEIASGYSASSAGPITLIPTIAPQTFTVTIASPGVFTVPTTAIPGANTVILSTDGALPTGLTAGVTYYVVNSSGFTFQLALTLGGTPITTSGTQSGTHTVTPTVFVTVPSGSRWVIL
jgi:hypothetical protein